VPIAGISSYDKRFFAAVLSTSFFLLLPFNLTTTACGLSLDEGSSIESGSG